MLVVYPMLDIRQKGSKDSATNVMRYFSWGTAKLERLELRVYWVRDDEVITEIEEFEEIAENIKLGTENQPEKLC